MSKTTRYVPSTVLAAVLALIIAGPQVTVPFGPVVVRSSDLIVASLCIYIVFSRDVLRLPERTIYLAIPLVVIGVYSSVLAHFAIVSPTDTLIELMDLAIILTTLLISPTILAADSEGRPIATILNYSYILTVLGSVCSIIYFVLTQDRFVGSVFAFGFPAIGIYYGVRRYARASETTVLIGVLIILTKVILSRTRSIWIFMPLAGLIAFFVFRSGNFELNSSTKLYFVSSALAVGGASILLFPSLYNRFLSLFTGSQLLFARAVLIYVGVSQFLSSPMGIGLGGFTEATRRGLNRGDIQFSNWFVNVFGDNVTNHVRNRILNHQVGPHSDFLKFITETGWVGGLAYGVFAALILKLCLYKRGGNWTFVLSATMLYLLLSSTTSQVLLSGGGTKFMIIAGMLVYDSTNCSNTARK